MTQRTVSDNRQPLALATTELAVGGAERCLTSLAVGLAARGFAVQVYSLRPPPPESQSQLVGQLAAAHVPVHFLQLRGWLSLPGVLTRFRRLLLQQHPAILQTFLYHANLAGALATRWIGAPRLVTGLRVADPRRRRGFIERWLTRRADRVVCVSQSVQDYAHSTLGFSPDRFVVIPNGIDMSRYAGKPPASFATWGIAPNRHVLLSIGRLEPQKGFDELIRLAPRLFAQLPNHDLVIVGAGPERERLLADVRAAGLAERVHLIGWQPPDELPALLAACQMVLIPSRWEGMSNVLLEAMAAGRPVVVTDVAGVREVLGPLAPSQLVPSGDPAAFLDRVVAIARSADTGGGLGQQNRSHVANLFSLDAMIDRYVNLYESLGVKPG